MSSYHRRVNSVRPQNKSYVYVYPRKPVFKICLGPCSHDVPQYVPEHVTPDKCRYCRACSPCHTCGTLFYTGNYLTQCKKCKNAEYPTRSCDTCTGTFVAHVSSTRSSCDTCILSRRMEEFVSGLGKIHPHKVIQVRIKETSFKHHEYCSSHNPKPYHFYPAPYSMIGEENRQRFGDLVKYVDWNNYVKDQSCACNTTGDPSYVLASFRIVAMTEYRILESLGKLYEKHLDRYV